MSTSKPGSLQFWLLRFVMNWGSFDDTVNAQKIIRKLDAMPRISVETPMPDYAPSNPASTSVYRAAARDEAVGSVNLHIVEEAVINTGTEEAPHWVLKTEWDFHS